MKLREVMAELKSGKVFCPCLAHLGVIEFQKRGNPHAYLVYVQTRRTSTSERDGQLSVGANSRRDYC